MVAAKRGPDAWERQDEGIHPSPFVDYAALKELTMDDSHVCDDARG